MSEKYTRNDTISIPAMMFPSFRTSLANQEGFQNKLLFRTWGGLGDQICAEPTLRFALQQFKDCEVALASERAELFSHLKFKRVFDLGDKDIRPAYEKYLLFDTITSPDSSNLVWQFMSHMLTNCVDFPSLCALRTQLPNKDKDVLMTSPDPVDIDELKYYQEGHIFIHAGRHWPSKTFPKDFWDTVISQIKKTDLVPVLIGANTDDNRGTVDVDAEGCVDLRNKFSILESMWLLHRCKVLLTNDSAPLHMAASRPAYWGHEKKSDAPWIGYVATCKHPDFITHWRFGEWSYRMVNHGKGGIWDVIDNCPNKAQDVTAEFVEEDLLRSWLPDPVSFADWAIEKASL